MSDLWDPFHGPEWLDRAACASVDPAVFVGPGADVDRARLICAGCPVLIECSEHAGETASAGTIWAGLMH